MESQDLDWGADLDKQSVPAAYTIASFAVLI